MCGLAGACDFTLGKDQNRVETGALVINEPMDVHAMRAGPMGVLLAWMWTGDVCSIGIKFDQHEGIVRFA